MTVKTSIEVTGLQDALRTIGKTDKELRRQLTKDFTKAAAPMLETAISRIPSSAPLSGMVRNWRGKPFWSQSETGKKGVRIKLDSRRPRYGGVKGVETVGALRLQTRARLTAVYDMAGKANKPSTPQGEALIRELKAKHGPPSRMMWPAAESTIGEVQNNLRPVIRKVMEAQSKALR
jgi:hypothetical protein